jgi:hypothetical protein
VHERLRQVLAARQHQAARVAARIGHAHQFEVARDVLVVDRLAVELLEQREHHVGLPALDLVTDGPKLVVDAQWLDIVAGLPQRVYDVVFGFPVAGFLLAESLV